MAGVQVWASFGTGPATGLEEAHMAILGYLALAGLAALVDWARGTTGTQAATGIGNGLPRTA
jgi:hypothetical protein